MKFQKKYNIYTNKKETVVTSATTDGDNLYKASRLADMTLKIHQTAHSIIRSTENLSIPIPEM